MNRFWLVKSFKLYRNIAYKTKLTDTHCTEEIILIYIGFWVINSCFKAIDICLLGWSSQNPPQVGIALYRMVIRTESCAHKLHKSENTCYRVVAATNTCCFDNFPFYNFKLLTHIYLPWICARVTHSYLNIHLNSSDSMDGTVHSEATGVNKLNQDDSSKNSNEI